jgi:hypothetical protein
MSSFLCADCGVDTSTQGAGEYYMLRNPVWRQASTNHKAMKCIGCVEAALARRLTIADFAKVPVNDVSDTRWGPVKRSARLLNRLTAEVMV